MGRLASRGLKGAEEVFHGHRREIGQRPQGDFTRQVGVDKVKNPAHHGGWERTYTGLSIKRGQSQLEKAAMCSSTTLAGVGWRLSGGMV